MLDLVNAFTLFRFANFKKKLAEFLAAAAFRMAYELTKEHSG